MRHHPSSRRSRLLAQAALLLAIGTLGPLATVTCAQSAPQAQQAFTLKPLGRGVYAAMALVNAGFVIGTEGVLVVDTFDDAQTARQLLEQIRKLTTLPIKYVVNTHYHIDHVSGNAVFTNEGAQVIAHRGLGGRLRENLKFFGANPPEAKRAQVEALVPPRLEFEGVMTVQLGGLEVQLFTLPGHTGNDTVVLVPRAGVLFTGDLFWCGALPNMIDGQTSAWIGTLDKLAREPRYAATAIVPGHGDLGDKQKLGEFRDYLTALTLAVDKGWQAGERGEALTESAVHALTARYSSWRFGGFLKSNVEHVVAEKAASVGASQR